MILECEEPLETVARQRLDLRRENPARQRMGFAYFVGVAAAPSTLPCHTSQNSDHCGQDLQLGLVHELDK